MRIAIFVPADVHSLELAGLMDVFAEANARIDRPFYEVTIVAEGDSTIRCASGLRLQPDCAFNDYSGNP
ncbi:AraC family transcriptional regulator, partial [Rhizobium sp. NPDC090279]